MEFFEWTEEDFSGHPDLNCISIASRDKVQVGCKVVRSFRHGRGHVLSDGLVVFPGDQFVTELVTE